MEEIGKLVHRSHNFQEDKQAYLSDAAHHQQILGMKHYSLFYQVCIARMRIQARQILCSVCAWHRHYHTNCVHVGCALILSSLDKTSQCAENKPIERRVVVDSCFVHAGDDALPSFKYLMASGAKYNQQAWKELGELPPTPPADTPLTA